MELERKQDLAVYFYIKDLFADASFINVEDGHPTTELQLPTVAVDAKTIRVRPHELGNRQGIKFRVWYADIYAPNKSQRDEIGYKILSCLEDNISVYNYDEGFPPDQDPSEIGCLIPDEIFMEIIRVVPDFVEKLYWRATVSFRAVYQSK